ncbi:MAG: DUF2961 domain-containing protein [Phycisphaerales bacterium]|nr:MAG: DUF2961 domain-containing protein [Phycisphaerales bacterium]
MNRHGWFDAGTLLLISSLCSPTTAAAQTNQPEKSTQVGAAYALLDRLTQLPGQFMVLQSSSHNKTGNNGDENWPLYKDERGDEVIFDAAGPGCVRSIWGTHFDENAVLNFYFDGEDTPRYSIREIDFFTGEHPDFPAPLNAYERRGEYAEGFAGNSFVPIPYRESLKISITGESRFFHVLYEQYPFGTEIETFTGREQRPSLLECFDRLGADPVTDENLEVIEVSSETNHPDSEVVLFERKEAGGLIRRLVLEADGSAEFLRESEIRMRWDGHKRDDVRAPAGFFFGCANHACNVASLPLSVEKLPGGRARLNCYFPMPFWEEARVSWHNGSQHTLGPLTAKVTVAPNRIERASGAYFTTLYRSGQTTYGRDWLLYESPGTGWFVGVVQSMQNGHYCEGDEHFYIDGALSPQINGTGSEDYYLGCFWPNREYSSPFACCAGDIQAEGGGHFMGAYRIPSCYSRFHLEAPIPFFRSINARIQHGGLSHLRSNYRSLAFCYLRKHPGLRLTDFIDVGSRASETAHDYTATRSEPTGPVTASPEGGQFESLIDEVGRRHAGGEISFAVAIDPANKGVRLRRRLDQGSPRQTVDVYVDGSYAGRWYHGLANEHLRWFDSDIDILPKYTRGKDSLKLKLVVDTTGGRGAFTDFNYYVYCFSDPSGSRRSSGG